ncbi:hypothetical protein SALBM311S_10323 [Streptomyces alboniger]
MTEGGGDGVRGGRQRVLLGQLGEALGLGLLLGLLLRLLLLGGGLGLGFLLRLGDRIGDLLLGGGRGLGSDPPGREGAAAKAAAEEEAEEAEKKAEAERLAELAKQYTLPTSSYTITSTFGSRPRSSGYQTGLDFAAPTGTIKAVHSGTITEAGCAGSYGYRTILTLDDGTELWFCHQSSISVSVGQKVSTGDVIGRVGATGNVTWAHLHLEVHSGGADTGIDPMAWLRSKGLNP